MARHGYLDECVIYESAEDGCWIAHSLATDQIGTGGCVLEALVDVWKAVRQVLELAEQEPDVQPVRRAPARIRRMAQHAQRLPDEIHEIACKQLTGDWPEDFQPSFKTPPKRTYRAEIREAVGA
jgi:hypothetical protein